MRRLLAFAILLVVPAGAFAAVVLTDRFGNPTWQVSGQSNSDFGTTATTAGDVDGDGYSDVIVGAPFEDSTLTNEGVAYLFRGSNHGSLPTPSWVFRGRQADAHAGYAVAPAGDVDKDGFADVLVAIPDWDSPGHANSGKVVVFHGGSNGLSTTPAYELHAPVETTGEGFSTTVAPAGDVNGDGYADVLVGSQFNQGGFVVGAVYLFEGGVGGLFTTPAKTWIGKDGADSFLGKCLSTAGDVNGDGFSDVILGSPGEVSPFAANGAAYVYLGSPSGMVATPDTVIKGVAANVHCGQSVSVAGDVNGDGYSDVIIGVPQSGTNFPGKAMIGLGGPQGITTVTDLVNPDGPANEFTGMVVSTVGDINGDGLADVGVVSRFASVTNRGRVSVYLGSFTGLQYFGEILTHGTDGFFGLCLGTSGDTDGDGFSEVLVGTEEVSVQPGQHEGVVFQFKPPKSGLLLATGGWPRSGGDPGTGYGSSLAILSRFDPVFTAKLFIGDPQFGGIGRVSYHSGLPAGGVTFNEAGAFTAGGSFWSFGAKLVDAGDTDGDTFCDLVVSAPTVDNGPASQAGIVRLQRGGAGALPAPVTILTGVSSFDRVGSALAGRGDVNGDGYADVLVGAREWDEPGKADCGKVFLLFGGPGGIPGGPQWTRVGDVAGQGFGASVALTDFDGDGYSDVIVGSSSPTFASTAPGKVEIFYGGPGNPSNTPGVVYLAPGPEVSFGLTLGAIGDVNGDGIADLGVGAPAEGNMGVVRIYRGNPARSKSQAAFLSIYGTQAGARFGDAIAGGGDVDGDGIGDMVIGEPGWDGGQTDEGRFSLYYGSPQPSVVPAVVIESNIVGAKLGGSFAPFHDINLDGFADVVVGAPGATGRVYPYFGGGTFGMRNELQLVDYGGSNPRAFHPALSHDDDQVATTFFQHVAAQGRTKLGFDIELKPSSQLFDGTPTTTTGPDAFDSGTPGSTQAAFTISQLIPPLPGRTLHLRGRWTNRNPLFPRSRWITSEAHTSGDYDVRIAGTSVGTGDGADPGALRIQGVAPNPSSGGRSSVVSFTLPVSGHVALDVYDVRGARVRTLLDESRAAGPYTLAWDGRDARGIAAASGVYMMVLRSAGAVVRTKLVRLP